jgi:flagellar hook-associated protein 1 FlgK
MTANYVALQTTGNNIANANVEGYSRQRVELATAPSQSTGQGRLGLGVDVKSISRSHDQFLAREASSARSTAEMDKTVMSSLSKLEELFQPGEAGLGHAAGQFLNAMTGLASRPTDLVVRQAALAKAQEVSVRFSGAARRMDAMQADVKSGLDEAVKQVNSLAQGLGLVNQKILSFSSAQGAPNDLLDERDRLLSRISEKLQIRPVAAANETVSVFVSDGRPLVLGTDVRQLTVISDPLDANRSALALMEGSQARLIDSESLVGGEIAGLLKFQNLDLVHARNLMGQMAAGLVGAVNQQQRAGLDLNGQPGQDIFFDFHQPGTGALPMVRSAATNKVQVPDVKPEVKIDDVSKLQAAEYALSWDDAGAQWTLQSSSGSSAVPVGDAQTQLGFSVAVPPTLDTDSRFLIQPVTYAAGFMRRVLGQGEGLAAASASEPNGNALAMAELAEKSILGSATLSDVYASAIADMGTRTQAAMTTSEISTAVADQAELRRSSADGVNLDEEAARLIQSQQAYQASAKVLQVAQSIFDTLLQAAAV